MSSLTAIGTPASRPDGSVIASASASACSGSVVRNAFRRGLICSIRRRNSSTSSRGCAWRRRTNSASATGPANARSCSVVVLMRRSFASSVAECEKKFADRPWVAVRDPAVLAVEQLDRVAHAVLLELLRERLGAEVQEPLIALAGVEVDPAHAGKRFLAALRHPHRVERQPALP